jgi:thiamine transport system permease protein
MAKHEESEMIQSFVFTFIQAFASALVAFVFGFIGAMGLISISDRPRLRRIFSLLAITPNALPIIFIIFIFIEYLPWAKGLKGIVLAHSFLNVGLVSFSLHQLFQDKVGSYAELAWIEGASRWQFLTKLVLPLLKNDLARIFFFVFAICFASFAIPLMLSGNSGPTLEVLIYEKVRIAGDWSQAFILSSAEIFILFILSIFLKNQSNTQNTMFKSNRLLSFQPGLIFVASPAVFIVLALAHSLSQATHQNITADFTQLVSQVTLNSYVIAIASGLLSLLLLMVLAYQKNSRFQKRFLLGLSNPSAVILGFAFLFCFRQTGAATFYKIIFGLSLMHLPILYRLSWDNQLSNLKKQIEIAETMGASSLQIFSKVTAPQLIRPAYNLAGLAALWSFADFTFARVVAEKDLTLPQVFAQLSESYRFEQADSLLIPMIVGSLLCYILFSGVGYVASRSA